MRNRLAWKRLPINGRLRLGVILALALVALALAFLTFRAFQTPTTITYQVPLWGWVHSASWDYSVFVKPNSIYESRELGPGLTYYGALVEGIRARFSYAFGTDSPVRIEGWYEVTANLQAQEGLVKRTVVVPRVPVVLERGTNLTGDVEVPVDLALFRNRAKELAAETGLRDPGKATVTYTAHVEATAAGIGGTVSQVLEPTLVVPLGGETFTLSGDRSLSKNGVIRRTEKEPRPGVEARRRYFLLATGGAALLLLLFPLAIEGRPQPDKEDPLARKARSLRRKYRKRMAQTRPGAFSAPGQEVVSLATMGDLARVSDELLKPIVYSGLTQAADAHTFFVVDGAVRYEYRLALPILPGKKEGLAQEHPPGREG